MGANMKLDDIFKLALVEIDESLRYGSALWCCSLVPAGLAATIRAEAHDGRLTCSKSQPTRPVVSESSDLCSDIDLQIPF